MTGQGEDLAALRARLDVMRRRLGVHLATYRQAAGLSQPQLGQAIGRTRSALSKIEHGQRRMSEALWKIADDLCAAEGVLIAEHQGLVQAECDYRAQCRLRRHQDRQAAAQAQIATLRASPAPSFAVAGCGGWPDEALMSGQLAEELVDVITALARSVGRRDALHMISLTLAAIGLSDLDPDEHARLAYALASPSRTDTHVIDNLANTLAQCKRVEDTLGPCHILDTVLAQHRLVRRLLAGSPDHLHKPLSLLDSNLAAAIGGYLIDMGHPDHASRYFTHARRAAHQARNPSSAAYAAAKASFVARLRDDIPAALDHAAIARSLAARTHDTQLQAVAEQMAAGAYAADGQYSPCMAANTRAHNLLTNVTVIAESPAYWINHSIIDTMHTPLLSLLGKHQQAVEAATAARAGFDRTYVKEYAICQARLGHALVLSHDISQAAHVLTDVAALAHLSPRLTADLHATRQLMQPWAATNRAVKELDLQLRAYGLTPPDQKS